MDFEVIRSKIKFNTTTSENNILYIFFLYIKNLHQSYIDWLIIGCLHHSVIIDWKCTWERTRLLLFFLVSILKVNVSSPKMRKQKLFLDINIWNIIRVITNLCQKMCLGWEKSPISFEIARSNIKFVSGQYSLHYKSDLLSFTFLVECYPFVGKKVHQWL